MPGPSTEGLLIKRRDLDRLTAAAFAAAVGVMLALCVAAAFWPAPHQFTGSHAVILDSMLGAQRVEPREKVFFVLAVAIGFVVSLAALLTQRPVIACSRRTLALLAAVVAAFNLCCHHALNDPSGAMWALGGLAAVLLLAWVAMRASR
jgi:hypothetical protein